MLLPPGQKERYFLFFIIIPDENNGDENRSSTKLTNEKTPFFSRVLGLKTNTPTDHETIYQSCFQKQHREERGFVSGDHRDHLHVGRRVGGRHRRRLRRRVRPKPILRRRLAGT